MNAVFFYVNGLLLKTNENTVNFEQFIPVFVFV